MKLFVTPILCITVFLFSCKKISNEQPREIINQQINYDSPINNSKDNNKRSIKNDTVSQNKEMVVDFYSKLNEDDFLSVAEFQSFFGTLYDEAERYFKRKSNISQEEIKKCFNYTELCESEIFSEMKKMKDLISYDYSLTEIKSFIKASKVKGNQVILSFPNKHVVTFYFSKRNNTIIDNIMIDNKRTFLEKFWE